MVRRIAWRLANSKYFLNLGLFIGLGALGGVAQAQIQFQAQPATTDGLPYMGSRSAPQRATLTRDGWPDVYTNHHRFAAVYTATTVAAVARSSPMSPCNSTHPMPGSLTPGPSISMAGDLAILIKTVLLTSIRPIVLPALPLLMRSFSSTRVDCT